MAQRPRVQNASTGEVALERRAEQRLESAQRLLFDGRYADAVTAFDIVLDQPDVRGIDTLTSWASHGMAVAEALNGHLSHARALYVSVLRLPAASPIAAAADSIEAAVLTEQHGAAAGLLDRFAEGHRSALAQQYVHSFRGLDLALAGKCTSAVAEVGRAVDVERPIPQAVRGLCAAKAGHHEQALALRDSVLTHPLADPMSWPMIVARGVAMRIK
ncbi:MAG TPA: hypothetical protein VGI97_07165 [Gemmatimonadaceae bacterium]